MILTGINGCTGTIRKTFKIRRYSMKKEKITISVDSAPYPYAKAGVKPKPVVMFEGSPEPLAEGRDYKLSYVNNRAVNDGRGAKKPAVKVTGLGNFKDTNSLTTFAIAPADLQTEGIKVAAKDVEFRSKAGNWKTGITLVDRDGKKLKAGKDYDKNGMVFSYDEAGENPVPQDAEVPAGTTIHVKVKGLGAYTGFASGTYRIIKPGYDIGKLKAQVDGKLYTGKPVTISGNEIKWTRGKDPVPGVTFETDGDSYQNNVNKGKARVTVHGTGEWGGTRTVTFKIGSRGVMWWWRSQ
jgi:hypothetical protein